MAEVWLPPPACPVLQEADVHIWRARLDRDPADVRHLRALLSETERQRADRFVREIHGSHFTVARGVLRQLLGTYLSIHPETIVFVDGPAGKPALHHRHAPVLEFNMSHSCGVALYALTRFHSVGIDVELVRPYPTAREIAERFYSERERAILRTVPEQFLFEAFFNAWTRKEALLKCHGAGLSYGLDRVEVTLLPGESARILSIDNQHVREDMWTMTAFHPYPGYVGAVVVSGAMGQVCSYDYTG